MEGVQPHQCGNCHQAGKRMSYTAQLTYNSAFSTGSHLQLHALVTCAALSLLPQVVQAGKVILLWYVVGTQVLQSNRTSRVYLLFVCFFSTTPVALHSYWLLQIPFLSIHAEWENMLGTSCRKPSSRSICESGPLGQEIPSKPSCAISLSEI